jgi:UDP-MurNAc hydroxylase
MTVEFVNHASYIVSHNGVRLICDPWTEGTAFDNGWSLLAKTKFSFEDYKTITHMWFSHEHPDHFSPPNLLKIPEEYRKNITVLYHQTNDKKVVNWCKAKGFKETIELEPDTLVKLADEFEIMNSPFLDGDSWIFMKVGGKNLLNINDCVVNTANWAQKIKDTIKSNVDILFTQFSYARYYGNADEPEYRKRAAADKLDENRVQIAVFKPRYIVPFASYVWFSHEENYYMNDEINKIDVIYDFLKGLGVTPVVLYVGETTDFEAPHDSQASVRQWMDDYEQVGKKVALGVAPKVTLEEMTKNAAVMNKKVTDKYGKLYFKLKQRHLKPLRVYITDLDATVQYSFLDTLKVKKGKGAYDISMSSEAFNFGLKFDFGFGTTVVNGRLQKSSNIGMDRYETYCNFTGSINHALEFGRPNYLKLGINKMLRIMKLR